MRPQEMEVDDLLSRIHPPGTNSAVCDPWHIRSRANGMRCTIFRLEAKCCRFQKIVCHSLLSPKTCSKLAHTYGLVPKWPFPQAYNRIPSNGGVANWLLDNGRALQVSLYIEGRLEETNPLLLKSSLNPQAIYSHTMAGKRKPGAAGDEANKAQKVSPLSNSASAESY